MASSVQTIQGTDDGVFPGWDLLSEAFRAAFHGGSSGNVATGQGSKGGDQRIRARTRQPVRMEVSCNRLDVCQSRSQRDISFPSLPPALGVYNCTTQKSSRSKFTFTPRREFTTLVKLKPDIKRTGEQEKLGVL